VEARNCQTCAFGHYDIHQVDEIDLHKLEENMLIVASNITDRCVFEKQRNI
jgi:hypothetical protein